MSDPHDTTPSCPQIDVEAARAGAEAGDATLVDVRGADEYAGGHPAGARNLPLDRLPEALDDLPAGPITFTCGSGRRSQKAADLAVQAGRTDVANMAGGFEAWQDAGLPVQPDPGPTPDASEPA